MSDAASVVAEPVRLPPAELESLCVLAMEGSATSPDNARSTARALVAAELDGQVAHGVCRLPGYAAQARSGKVDGRATPTAERVANGLLRVDARSGFAFPAIDLAAEQLPAVVAETGVAAAAVHHSHHFGQAGAHAERLAAGGLLALVFSNTPKAIAFWGGRAPMLGTNPIAFAAPRRDAAPLVIDLALSRGARGKIKAAERAGRRIPSTWALDADGQPTSDPAAALKGSLLPIGDAKGAALVLMVELITAALTGSNFGFEASSFYEATGRAPQVGHLFVVFDPAAASGGRFHERLETIIGAIESTDGARMPGALRLEARRRAAESGVDLPPDLYQRLRTIAEAGNACG